MHTKVLLLLGLCGLAIGQFHARNDGVYNGLVQLLPKTLSFSQLTMCYTGNTIYISSYQFIASSNTFATTITRLDASTNYAVENPVLTIPDAPVFPSIDCCCQYVAYGHVSGTNYKVFVLRTDNFDIYKEYTIAGSFSAVVKLDCTTGLLHVVSRTSTYEFNIANPSTSTTAVYVYGSIVSTPRCAAFVQSGGSEHLFMSFEDRPSFMGVDITGGIVGAVTPYEVRINDEALKIACLTANDGSLNFLSRSASTGTGYLLGQTFNNILISGGQITTFATMQSFGLPFGFNEFLNGLGVCANCQADSCLTSTCSCVDAACGFCLPTNVNECVCTDAQEVGCVYNNQAVADGCIVPFTRADASCVVLNPIAERRSGGDVNVALVHSQSDTVTITNVDIQRAAKTGRFGVLLPRWQALGASANLMMGYRSPVQRNQRGRRFGVFDTAITRSDGFVENIFCIATEKSAFRNQVFTQVCIAGQACTMTASMDNAQYLNEVRWRRTSLITRAITDFPDYDGSLTLVINTVSKLNHEGVYEVFRVKRYLRTWHPIINLYVRECPLGFYGTQCDTVCANCNNGICDSGNGGCRCYPGFTGTNCNSICVTANMIGQSCDINCDSLFSGTAGNNCVNLEICNGDDLGCQCRSGLMLPDCTNACPLNTWGTNCASTCSCASGVTCDARRGCVV